MLKTLRPLLVFVLLGACALPRGAPVEREVLASIQNEHGEHADFSLYPVTRATLPAIANWPVTDNVRSFGWIPQKTGAAEVLIQPFDHLDLVVWDSEENSLLTAPGQKLVDVKNLRVTEGGQVFVPYLGYLRVAGKSQDAARMMIEREMMSIVPSVQVQLNIKPGTRTSVSLVGGVKAPGTFPLVDGNFTVLNLISIGGGPEPLRNPQVRLIRGGRTYGVSLKTLYDNPSQDTVLRGGDKVALVDDDRYFRALGASGIEEIVYFEENRITALDAMSMMGGLDERSANPQGVLILRQYPASAVRTDGTGPEKARTIFALDMTTADGLFSAARMRVYSGDTILVTESPVNAARTVFGLAGTLIGFNTQFQN